ncbi:iron ABC transporter ATP-binding protein [Candidatus Methanomassiliicoccus intestinalis]|uniref:Iron ABC transporter ATP-binding protein n=1 Tax=Candidatus Methanomassiliicoccus intestinalis TaxID=1406512 RepID=A0A8J8TD72_9ARCH|nr:MAG: iron ABC transporter ATP-binding protein [Candidatus Methanomassiliicoccus intestinalis]
MCGELEIKLDEVHFSYNAHQPVLRRINMILDQPGLTCIIGPNGVGKSTLIKCIDKLLRPTEGEVTLDGRSIKNYTLSELSKIMGFVPASSSDNFSMTVVDTVLMGRHPFQKIGSEKEDMHIVYETLKALNITHLAMRNYDELSAGQHQKVALARGLAQQPAVLLLDEPTANLDVRHQVKVIELLHKLAHEKGMIIIMVSHDLNIAVKYADKIIVMSTPGVIYKVGLPNDVITEETIRYVYGMNCQIIEVEGRPHIILGSAISDEEMVMLHKDEDFIQD